MSALRAKATTALVALAVGIVATPAHAQEEGPEEPPTIRMARATWDTGWFQAEVYRQLLNRLGYQVEGPVTMENQEFYDAVASGEVDLWVNGWFPLHESLVADDSVELVGTQVDSGALQGYFVDIATAERLGVTSLGDLADPDIASAFDADGNGLADLIGCNVEWACAATVDHHLDEYGLGGTVEHVQGAYSPLMGETIERYESGEPVLFYTFTPNWTVGELVPGVDVNWLETPYPSLPEGQTGEDRTEVAGLPGCVNDPCQTGWPPNDIRAVANSGFLNDNPSVRALLEQVALPLDDILDQNARMVDGEGDPGDIRRQAEDWIAANEGAVARWLDTADPDAVPIPDNGAVGTAPGGVLRIAVRELPPFVIYESRSYGGFEIELAGLLGTQLGSEIELYAVDTVAKQIDDVRRGVADVAMGGVAITQSREEEVDFSLPLLNAGLTILVASDSEQGLFPQIRAFFTTIANSDLPWLLIVFGLAVLVAAHLIWLSERRDNPDFAEGYGKGIWDSFYWSVVTMSTVGYGDKVARGNTGRVLALIWIATGTLVFATFTAAIASALAVEEIRGDIAGPSDLPGNRVATVSGSAGQPFLSSLGLGSVLVDDVEEAYDLLEGGDVDAVVFDAPVLHFHATRQGAGAVATVGPDFETVQYGVVVAHDESDLREDINLALLEIIESGAYAQLHDKWFGASS